MVRVRPASGRSDLKKFIEYPFELYRDDPNWVPPLLISEWEKFNPKKNPFYQHARVDLFLAEDDGRVVGRVAGIDDDNHNLAHGDNLAFFGFFEAEGPEAAAALYEAVEAWARGLGRAALRGPANPSMNDGSGFQIDAFETLPFIMMPQNPADYPRYAKEAGYAKVKDLYAWHFDCANGMGERLERLVGRIEKRYRPTVRSVDMKRFKQELGFVKKMYNEAWEQNWGFVKYTEEEFDHLASELKMIIDPDIALFVEMDGEPVGLAIALPDANQVFKLVGGRLLPFGIFTLLNRKKHIDRARLPILGVMPAYRNKGLELVLINEVYRRAAAKGYKGGECSWVLEDNEGMNAGIRAAGCELYKTYRLYQKALA